MRFIEFKRIIGQSGEHGKVYCIERETVDEKFGPTDLPGMVDDITNVLATALSEIPEYSSLRVTFEVMEPDDVVVEQINAETAESWRAKNVPRP